MVVRIKGIKIDNIEETETKRLNLVKASSKDKGVEFLLELPDVLSEIFNVKDLVDIVVDSDEIAKGDDAKFYAEGDVFKKSEENGLEVIGTIGGLRLILKLTKPTQSQKKTFEADSFFIRIN